MRFLLISAILLCITSLVSADNGGFHIWWQLRNMYFCNGDLKQNTKYDGQKSIVEIPGDNKPHSLVHTLRFADLTKDVFVMELGKVDPSIRWELIGFLSEKHEEKHSLLKGTGGGAYKVQLSQMGYPRWTSVEVELQVQSDKPGKMEIIRWAVETPGPNKFAKQQEQAHKALARNNPLERGLIPHWNYDVGSFVCAYNPTHPEHYNFWLEDEGEMLWSLGNYPEMMKLYGKGLRDIIVNYSKFGAPVRKVNTQPLMAHILPTDGKFYVDTGLLTVDGNLSEDPHINLHHSVYEAHGLLASLGNFFVSYQTEDGSTAKISIAESSDYQIAYDTPKREDVRLIIKADDNAADAEFFMDVFRGRVTVNAKVTNKGQAPLQNVVVGFDLKDCKHYFKKPLNKHLQFGDVAILYSEQPMLENCNIVRLAGPAAKNIEPQFDKENEIEHATASAVLSKKLSPGAEVSSKLADVNAGASSFAEKIEKYKDVDFYNADISTSYVSTYALLGLATYSYRYPEDKEAREVTDLMIENFLQARDRIGDRELAYFLWVLALLGREKDANEIADLIEKRTVDQETIRALNGAAMGIGLRAAGRWEAADRITKKIEEVWDFGVVPATEFLGSGALQSPACIEKAYKQLSYVLCIMFWDEPDKITAHNDMGVEEGPEETQCYTLVALDIFRRLYGGFAPLHLDPFAKGEITNMSYDEKSGEFRVSLINGIKFDIFTSFRAPKQILFNGEPLSSDKWRYDDNIGVIFFTGLDDGELTLTVEGPAPQDNPAWPPIDYLGLDKR